MKYELLSPDGVLVVVEAPEGKTFEELIPLAQRAYRQKVRDMASKQRVAAPMREEAPLAPSMAETAGRQAFQGATLNLGDEAIAALAQNRPELFEGGALGALQGAARIAFPQYDLGQRLVDALRGQQRPRGGQRVVDTLSYEQGMDYLQARNRADLETNPVTAMAANVAGSLVPGAAIAKALPLAGAKGALGSGALVGGVMAGGEQRGADRLVAGGMGALLGGAGGLAGHQAAKYASRLLGGARPERAAAFLRDIEENAGIVNPREMLEELGPDAYPGMLRGLDTAFGEHGGTLAARDLYPLVERSKQVFPRMMEIVTGKGDEAAAFATRQEMQAVRSGAANDLFEEAYANVRNVLPANVRIAIPKKYTKTVFNLAGGREQEWWKPIIKDGQQTGQRLTFRGAQKALEEMGDHVGRLRRKGLFGQARALANARRKILTSMEEANPTYRQARAMWETSKHTDELIDDGRNFAKRFDNVEDLRQYANSLTPEERGYFNIGVGEHLSILTQRNPNWLKNARLREQVRAIDPQMGQRLERQVGVEEAFSRGGKAAEQAVRASEKRLAHAHEPAFRPTTSATTTQGLAQRFHFDLLNRMAQRRADALSRRMAEGLLDTEDYLRLRELPAHYETPNWYPPGAIAGTLSSQFVRNF